MHQGKVDEAYKTHKQLQLFEPKFARGLKIDLKAMADATASDAANDANKQAMTVATQ
jgi:hypothetical protein